MRSIRPSLTKLIVFIVVTLAATGLLAVTIANTAFTPATHYAARFTDVTGLNEGDDVRIAGVKVGQVDSIRIADRSQAEVRFSLFDKRKLPATATAAVRYRNLIGQRYIALGQGPGPVNATLPEGGTIPLRQTRPALNLTVLFNGFKPLLRALSPQDVNKLSQSIIEVLQGEGGTVKSLLAHIASLTSTIAGRDEVIGQVINNLNSALDTINARGDEMSTVLTQTQELVSGLAADRRTIGDAIDGIGQLNQVTGGMLAESRPALREDIANLGALSKNLDDSKAVVQHFVQFLPDKLNTINRTASYGGWFNYFLCRTTGEVGISSLGMRLPLDNSQPMPARCQP
ncbi:MCE family protein [Gandjariella thermophila]|uniref:ABC transporter substrate-binding protein n=1 Tax=Gandjariella thermophila TaxID=1931992 RepID=A0A4D4J5F8_9PSEU|nr:MCE family protein [Gandjariella thermophila]GDY31771.1 ABC transporter substrate-binding protein [Gandjariella thermophila]